MTDYEITEFLQTSQKILRLDAEIEAEFYYKALETLTVGQREELVDRITGFLEEENKSVFNAKRLTSMLAKCSGWLTISSCFPKSPTVC